MKRGAIEAGRRIARGLGLGVMLLWLAACSTTFQNHGYVPREDDLAEIMVGIDTRETVAAVIGRPGTSGLLTDGGWYYVRSRFAQRSYHAPEEIERQVVAISFDKDGVVENIERFGLENGRVVVLDRRVTDSNIKGVGFLRQLFGSLGRINLSNVL